MRRALPFLVAACGAAPAPQAPSALSHHGSATCVIHDANIKDQIVHLAVGGREFALVRDPLSHLDVEVGAGRAHAHVETAALVLDADLVLDKIMVRPKQVLYDGWLGIASARLLASAGATVRLHVDMPTGIEQRSRTIALPCDDVTFAPYIEPGVEGDLVGLAPGRVPLRRSPNGEILAMIVPPGGSIALAVTAMLQRDGWTKIRIASTQSFVEGWVPAGTTSEANVYGGVLSDPIVDVPDLAPLSCDHDVPITFAGTPVGYIKAHHPIPILTRNATTAELYLGAEADPTVRITDLGGCHPPSGR